MLISCMAAVAGCAQLAGYEEYSFDRTAADAAYVDAGGGSNTGGAANTGGQTPDASGGAAFGGSNAGGSNTGGSNTGGSNTGGSNTGGSNTGGSNTGGSNTGGSNTGGSGSGGASAGGSGTGGSSDGSVWALSTVPASCPPHSGGPELVPVRGGYCIDRTEVTRSQYEAWLASNPSTDGQTALCSWNKDFTPVFWCLDSDNACKTNCGDHPQVCVDWCDAFAYCKAVGKRLCGKIGGGTNPPNEWNNAKRSELYNACSSGDLYDFPYSDVLDPQACNGMQKGIGTTLPVGSLASCQSPLAGYVGVMDLSGNATEWEDSCTLSAGPTDPCYVRGGGIADDIWLYCDTQIVSERSGFLSTIGFRCCSP